MANLTLGYAALMKGRKPRSRRRRLTNSSSPAACWMAIRRYRAKPSITWPLPTKRSTPPTTVRPWTP